MALDASNVRVAVTGAVYVAPTATTAPTDAVATLNVAFKDLGYVSDDGVTEKRDRSTEKIKAWQNASTVREVITETGMSYTFRLIETKKETVELYYGSAVSATDGSISINPANTGGRQSFVLDVIDGGQEIRVHIPSGEVTEVGEQVYKNGEPIGYEVTVTCYPDSSGVTAKKWYSALDTTP